MPEYQPMAHIENRDAMVRAYLECAEWSGLEDSHREPLELSIAPRWSRLSEARAALVCAEFEEKFGGDIGTLWEMAGRDLWLTRNRHGAGFWDGGWSEPYASQMTKWARSQGEAYVWFDAETETLHLEE